MIGLWRRLSIGAKLLLPILGVFALLLLTYFLLILPALNRLVEENTAAAFETQLSGLDARLAALLEDSRLTITSLAGSFEARELITYAKQGDLARLATAQTVMENRMANTFSAPRLQFADMRFLNAVGDQLARVRVGGIQPGTPGFAMGKESFINEGDRPYYTDITRLRSGQFYISAPSLALPIGQTGEATDLEFQIASPIYVNNEYAGAIVASFRPRRQLLEIFGRDEDRTITFGFYLLDNNGIPLAFHTAEETTLIYGDGGLPTPVFPEPVYGEAEVALTEADNVNYRSRSFASFAEGRYVNLQWRLVVLANAGQPEAGYRALAADVLNRTLTLLLAAAALFALVTYAVVRPLRRVTQGANRLAGGYLQAKIAVDSEDEIGQLGRVLNDMADRLFQSFSTMEQRVKDRTRNIELAADISRDASRIRNIDDLLQKTVEAIRDRFGFYHAQVFLIDDVGKDAILVTSTGEAGQKLLAMKHKLAVGSKSIIGTVTERRRAIVALDTQSGDVAHRFNPLLPLTRSEIALPLLVGDKIIGALDIQSVEPDAFNDDDRQIFQLLADQLAVAVDNARLLEAQAKQLREIDQLNRRLTRETWETYEDERPTDALAFKYDLRDVKPLSGDGYGDETNGHGMPAASGNGDHERSVELPIMVRGEAIGELTVTEDQNLPLTADDRAMIRAVADRVALAIENVRLVEQTRDALKRVEDLYETSKQITSAEDLEKVFRMASDRLAIFPGVEIVGVYLTHPTPRPDAPYIRFAHIWAKTEEQRNAFQVGGILPRTMLPPAYTKYDTSAGAIDGSNPDYAPDDVVRGLLLGLGIEGVAMTRLKTASRDFGAIFVHGTRLATFNETFLQYYAALGDQVAAAVENRWLFEQSEGEARRNRALAEAAQVAGQLGVAFEQRVVNVIQVAAGAADFDRWWYGDIHVGTGGIVTLRRITGNFPAESPLLALVEIELDVAQNALAVAARKGETVIVNMPTESKALRGLPPRLATHYGKHVAIPVRSGQETVGALYLGRDVNGADITERDVQLAAALASQIAITAENRRLFDVAQAERNTFQVILDSLPTGVMVVDAITRERTLINQQARLLLGLDEPTAYRLCYGNSDVEYEQDEFPINRVLETSEAVYAEDMTAISVEGRRNDLLVNVAPILVDGVMRNAVAVFQDVSELRELENVLQENLRETTTLYLISRAIGAENDLINILRVVASQTYALHAPDELLAILTDSAGNPAQSFTLGVNEDGGYAFAIEDGLPVPRQILIKDQLFEEQDVLNNLALSEDERLRARGVRGIMCQSLTARSRTVGWLILIYRKPRMLSTEERRTLASVADQTAVAAESVRLAEQTALALTTATLLYEASLNLNSAETIEGALAAIRDQLRYFEPSHVDILLVDPRSDERIADWVVRWRRDDPDSTEEVILENVPKFLNWAVINADPYFVEDVRRADPALVEVMSQFPFWGEFAAQASIPMQSKGQQIVGRLVISFDQPYQFGRTEQQVITTLADQGVVTLDNFQLVRQTQESLDETALLYQSSRAISSSLTPSEQLSAIIDYAVTPIITHAFLIRLLSEDWEAANASIRVIATWHAKEIMIDLANVRFTPDQFPAWAELTAGQVVWAEDLDDPDKSVVVDDAFYRLFDLRSVIVLPLGVAGAPIGVLILGSDQMWKYTERENRIYAAIADLLANAIERRRLLDQTEQRARQLQLSAQISKSAATILDLKDLFEQTIYQIKDGFEFDHVQIFRITEDGREARVVASTGDAGRELLRIRHYLPVGSRSVIGQVTEHGQPQIVSDTTDPRAVHRPNPYLPNTRAEMALPLIARNRILGALDVQSNEPGAFSADDVSVLSTLADQIAIAIDNAELFETSTRRAEEMRFLFDVTRQVASADPTNEEAYRAVAEQIMDNLGGSAAALLILDQTNSRLKPYVATEPGIEVNEPEYYDFRTPAFQAFVDERDALILNDLPTLRERLRVGTVSRLGQGRLANQFSDLLPDAGSMMVLPLTSGEILLGMIVVLKKQQYGFSDDILPLMQTLNSSTASTLQSARLLREVQEANVRLLELDKLKNQFLANMSHELRTPLNSIIGFSRVILKGIDGPLTEMQTQDLQTIYESGRHLLGLVNDILDQAKIEADRMEFNYTHFSMVDLVRGVMSTAVGLVKDKPIQLIQEIEADLPLVWGDEFRTRQALLNLVSNACKFTQQGNVRAAAFRIETEGVPMVQISITDTGIGIPNDQLADIFEPFRQVENTAARQYEGTGLGLPLARKMIERQGGKLWVESHLGVGSTFSFTIPVNPIEGLETAATQ